jgi:glycogen operon protein
MLLDGALLRDIDGRGRPVRDDSFLVLFNAGRAVRFVVPDAPDAWGWEAALATEPERSRRRGAALPPGSGLMVRPRQVQVLRSIQPRQPREG